MALTQPAGTDSVAMQALDRFEERLGAHLDRFEEQMRNTTWKVVVGTAVGVYLATVATVLGGIALLN